MIDLSIIIVSWNVRDLLRDCLRSIQQNVGDLSYEVIVVDSASADDTPAMIQAQFPDVVVLAQTENVGFTRGNNIGLQAAQGRHLFLLNPDTVILDNTLQQMVTYLDEHPTVGIVGPHTLNTDGTHQSTRRRFPTVVLAFFESTWLQPFAPKRLLDHFYARDIADSAVAPVDWVQGSAMMARREVYQQIGGLDTGFVMFSEEVDWCKRAQSAGWGTVYLGTARIIHHGGKSTEQVAARKHIHFQQSKLRYFRKHHGMLAAGTLRVFLLANYVWQILLEGTKALVGYKRPLRQERIRAYWQVLRSGLKVTR
ncbi:MAG: Glycosyltransferase, GT2 family [Chloroflexi bacterium AL-W]|nr:Glycosyltransferase, GT2 family [Chloroflexi bacterium AL-W]